MTVLTGHTDTIRALAFSPDGNTLGSASDGEVVIWDVRTWSVKRTIQGRQDYFTSIAFSPDGKTILVGSGGLLSDQPLGEVVLWPVDSAGPDYSLPFR